MITQLTGFFQTEEECKEQVSLGPIACRKESRLETSISQEVDIFKFLEKTKGLPLTLLSWGQGVWPLPLLHHYLLFYCFHLSFPSLYFLPVGKNDDNVHEREVKYHRKKIPQGLIFSWQLNCLPTPPLLSTHSALSQEPSILGLWFGSANP